MIENLVLIGFSNAVVVIVLALIVLAVTRIWRHPALAHLLWLIVLAKLMTPPLFKLPMTIAVANETSMKEEPNSRSIQRSVAVDRGGLATTEYSSRLEGTLAESATDVDPYQNGSENETDRGRYPKQAGVDSAYAQSPLDAEFNLASTATPETATPETATPEKDTMFVFSEAGWRGVLKVLAAIWVMGTLFVIALTAMRLERFLRMARRASSAPPELQQEIAQLARLADLHYVPDVRVCDARVGPLVFSAGGRALLLLPSSLLSNLNGEERMTMLAHELAHLRRRDHLSIWFTMLVASLYWWLPIVWLARRQVRHAADQCCDGWVLSWFPGHAIPYAESMMKAIDFFADGTETVVGVTSEFGQVNFLKGRFEMVLHNCTNHRLPWHVWMVTAAVAVSLLSISPLFVLGQGFDSRSRLGRDDTENQSDALKPQSVSTNRQAKRLGLNSGPKAEAAFSTNLVVASSDQMDVELMKQLLEQWRDERSRLVQGEAVVTIEGFDFHPRTKQRVEIRDSRMATAFDWKNGNLRYDRSSGGRGGQFIGTEFNNIYRVYPNGSPQVDPREEFRKRLSIRPFDVRIIGINATGELKALNPKIDDVVKWFTDDREFEDITIVADGRYRIRWRRNIGESSVRFTVWLNSQQGATPEELQIHVRDSRKEDWRLSNHVSTQWTQVNNVYVPSWSEETRIVPEYGTGRRRLTFDWRKVNEPIAPDRFHVENLSSFLGDEESPSGTQPEKRQIGEEGPIKLPKPLDHISMDLGPFAADFTIADIAYFQSGEFKTPDPTPREVAEETIVWTLAAKRDLSVEELQELLVWKGLPKEEVKKIFESDPRANFLFRVKFSRTDDGKEVEADARDQGYYLFTSWDRKEIRMGTEISVWTTLGKEGSANLLKTKATKTEIQIPRRLNQRED